MMDGTRCLVSCCFCSNNWLLIERIEDKTTLEMIVNREPAFDSFNHRVLVIAYALNLI